MSKLFRFRVAVGILTASGAIGLSFSADAARVRGTLGELEVAVTGKLLGFTRTRVAPAAKDGALRRRDTALFLAVKNGESFPIPAPTEHQIITIDGLRFSPNIATCASDAQSASSTQIASR